MTVIEAAIKRAVRTAAQAAVAAIPSTAVLLDSVNWAVVASTSGMAAVLSLLQAVAFGLPEADKK